MTEAIRLVQGDTRPALVVTLNDKDTGDVINITGATVRMKFKEENASVLADTLVGTVLDGAAGLCKFDWGPTSLSGADGNYVGEIEITFADGGVQTVYDLLRFILREDL